MWACLLWPGPARWECPPPCCWPHGQIFNRWDCGGLKVAAQAGRPPPARISPVTVSGSATQVWGGEWGHSHRCAPEGNCSGPLGKEAPLPSLHWPGLEMWPNEQVKSLSLSVTRREGGELAPPLLTTCCLSSRSPSIWNRSWSFSSPSHPRWPALFPEDTSLSPPPALSPDHGAVSSVFSGIHPHRSPSARGIFLGHSQVTSRPSLQAPGSFLLPSERRHISLSGLGLGVVVVRWAPWRFRRSHPATSPPPLLSASTFQNLGLGSSFICLKKY